MADRDAARFVVVQHADKQRLPGDPGLTELGHVQAERVARHLAGAGAVGLYASPQRRARETAAPIARAIGFDVGLDPRLAERMNWDGPGPETAAAFLAEWERTVVDRDYVPSNGDSSHAAAARFEAFLVDADRRHPDGPIVVVSHGGVTVDLLRNLLGDARLASMAPGVLQRCLPACGMTSLAGGRGTWRVLGVGKIV